MKQRIEVETEYAPAAAQRTRSQAAERAAQQAEHQRRLALPIEDRDELARAVARLAGTWGLKKKGRR